VSPRQAARRAKETCSALLRAGLDVAPDHMLNRDLNITIFHVLQSLLFLGVPRTGYAGTRMKYGTPRYSGTPRYGRPTC
jgi:hypothetical protein